MINKKNFNLIVALIPFIIIDSTFTFPIVKASGAIYIMSDGSVYPSDAPILTIDNITYMFTNNIYDSIVIERSNITIDGNGYRVEGYIGGYGFTLSEVNNVTIKNTEIENFELGIWLRGSFGNIVSDCIVANNSIGIEFDSSSNNILSHCNVTNNYCGIEFVSSDGNSVFNCKIEGNEYGIWLSDCSRNVIFGCNITDNECGVGLFQSFENTISKCSVTDNMCGLWFHKAFNSVVSECNITDNGAGIELHESSNNSLKGNALLNNEFNFGIFGVVLQDFMNNIDVSNTINEKAIYYIINKQDKEILLDAGYVALVNCTNIRVANLNLTKNWQGILLAFTTNSTISRSNIINNSCGILLYKSSNNFFSECEITANSRSGIEFVSSDGNSVFNCKIEGNEYGIWLRSSVGNFISDCGVTKNRSGLEFDSSSSNVVTKCSIADNGNGVKISYSSKTILSWCEITDNGYGARLDFSQRNAILNCNITNNKDGLWLHSSSGNVISESNITNNGCGIGLYESLENLICRNNIVTNNKTGGIWLHGSSDNVICRNNILLNSKWGIRLYLSSRNIIYGCHVGSNECGIWLYESKNNSFYHNNFIGNVKYLSIEGYSYANFWDDGYPSGGNYWSNYAAVDICSGQDQNFFGSDGIGDTPYAFDQNNIDRYPLMGIINTFEAGVWNGVSFDFFVVSNSTVSDFFFRPDEGASVKYSVSGEEGTNVFCRVSIPNHVLWAENGEWKVLVNGENVIPAIIMTENFTFLYFTFSLNTKAVTIQGTHVIPESSLSIIQRIFIFFIVTTTIFLNIEISRKTNNSQFDR